MNAIIGLGKYLFALTMGFFGFGHMTNAAAMAGMSPFGGEAMVYFTGVCLLLAAISIIIGKYDKLACVLLFVFLLLTALLIHAPGGEASMPMLIKDLGLAGAALMCANLAKDNSIIG